MEQLFNEYGVTGIVAGIFLTGVIFLFKWGGSFIKKIEERHEKEVQFHLRQIEFLKAELERLRDRDLQKTIDTHELMDDIKEAVKGLTNIAIGFREMVNIISQQLKK